MVDRGVRYHIFIKISFLFAEGKVKNKFLEIILFSVIIIPKVVTIRGAVFRVKDSKFWDNGVINNQFIIEPERIAPQDIISIGEV